MPLLSLLWLTVFVLTLITLISFIWVIAPFFPTRTKHLEVINKICNLKPGDKFYELGCGNGKVTSYLAKQNPKVEFVAIEMAVMLFLASKIKTWRQKNVTVKWKNLFWQDLSDADGLYVFAMTDSLNKKLKDKFLAELKPGTKIISYVFSMKDWPGQSEDFPQAEEKTVIHRYTV